MITLAGIGEVAIGRDGRWALEAGDPPRELGRGPAETLPVPAKSGTLEAIGNELDLTRERVRQLESQALARLAALRELQTVAAA